MTFPAVAAPARVALARSPVRMLAPTIAFMLLGAAASGLGAVIVGGAPGVALIVAGAVGVAIGLWLALRVTSLRLLVEPGYLHLRGLGTDRRYQLARGTLARVPTAGPRSVRLAVRLGSLGWTVGRATLPSGERVHLIRLGATPSVILVPTEQGRVAVAVASESAFADTLAAAARKRAQAAPPAEVVTVATGLAPTATPSAPAPMTALADQALAAARPAPPPMVLAAPAAARAEVRARPLTGIERMWLEDRLARERRAALVGARDEQAAASFTASVAALTPAGARVTPTLAPPAVLTEAPLIPPAAATAAPAPIVPPAPAAAAAPALAATAAASASALPRVIPRRRPSRPMARRVTRPELTPVLVLVSAPLAGALISWVLALIVGAAPPTEGMDPLTAALLLCGPVAALAIFLANSRWPRLAGLNSVSAMLALLLVARALIG